ncbi:MAG TPA: amidase family protein [Anaerolineae bacterium]|nr:amidase family protein [Anaerolineae bacterium]HPL27721.1 amidase family protein [Anaerolineae bacterium]
MLRPMNKRDIEHYAAQAGLRLDDDELAEFAIVAEFMLSQLRPLDTQPAPSVPRVEAVRDVGRRATRSEDPRNAIVRWCKVKGFKDGILSGKRVGLKDNFAISGIPMTCGSQLFQGYIPESDSVVAERLLQAGAEIVATLNMDDLAFSGGADLSAYGPILNPIDPTRTSGGSSGGAAVALYYEGIDITFGADQGGSIREPASWCGVLGLKPTFGLVPYTGILGLDASLDHAGPLARTTENLALGLQAVAGKHESDPRQVNVVTADYVAAVRDAPTDLKGITIGLVKEGFDPANVETESIEATLEAVERMRRLGARTVDVSIPEHATAGGISFATFLEGEIASLFGFGNGYHWQGRYDLTLPIALGQGLRTFSDDLLPQLKAVLIVGSYLHDHYFSYYYAKAQNLRPSLRAAYDAALKHVDFLVMPTTQVRAHKYEAEMSISRRIVTGWDMLGNTSPTCLTGHPALSMPAAEAEGLPVGTMLIGPMFSEARMLAFARTYEGAFDWCPSAAQRISRPRREVESGESHRQCP